jgi:hypothetical protein
VAAEAAAEEVDDGRFAALILRMTSLAVTKITPLGATARPQGCLNCACRAGPSTSSCGRDPLPAMVVTVCVRRFRQRIRPSYSPMISCGPAAASDVSTAMLFGEEN